MGLSLPRGRVGDFALFFESLYSVVMTERARQSDIGPGSLNRERGLRGCGDEVICHRHIDGLCVDRGLVNRYSRSSGLVTWGARILI